MGGGERENARKEEREKSRNSDFNIISFLLIYFFLSPLSRIFVILSCVFAFSLPVFSKKLKKSASSILSVNDKFVEEFFFKNTLQCVISCWCGSKCSLNSSYFVYFFS
jgi:hypothetical protein